MKNPFNHPAMIDISLLLTRVALGLFLLLAGWHKMSGPGLGGWADMVVGMRPSWLPEAIARPYGYAMPIVELLTGLMVILGLFKLRWAGGIMALLLLSVFIAVVNKYGISGGVDGLPFHFTIVFAMTAFMISIIGPGRLALDPLYFGGGKGA